MTETVLVSNLLFKNPTTLPLECTTMKLGQMGPAGIGASKYRKGVTSGAKISAAALVLDAIKKGKVSAIEGPSDVFVSYKSDDGNTYSSITSSLAGGAVSIKYVGEGPKLNWENAIPFFVFTARQASENTEFRNTLLSMAKVGFTNEEVLRMCDSLYYGSAQKKSVDISQNEIAPSTISAAVRSGLLNGSHDVLSAFGAPGIGGIDGVDSDTTAKREDDTAKAVDEFEEIRSGKRAISYSWTEEQQKRIPSLKTLDDFVPTAAFWKGSRKIKYRTDKILERLDMGLEGLEALGKDVINFFMTGKPGTGKTTVAKALAAAYQLPFYSVPVQKNTEEGTFQGLLKARDGKFVFTSTDFLEAFKNGGVIVLEELNLADPAVLSGAIGQAIESPYFVMEDELSPVYRHPMCIIIGTFNVGTAGSKEINPMLSSRFYQTYVVEDPNEDEFEARLMKYDCTKRDAKRIYTAYSRILDYLKSPDVSAFEYCKNVTFRGCVGAIQCLQEGAPFKEAIEDTLVGKIAEYDLELARDVLKNVVETLPD